MANDSSLGAAETRAFDLETQKGVMHLLASVRASDIGGERKNELRDLVFEYTNGGRDETVRRSLMQKVATYVVTPIVVATPEPEPAPVVETQYDFGTSRPAPSFSAPAAKPEAKAAPAPKSDTPEATPVDLPVAVPPAEVVSSEVQPTPASTPEPKPAPEPVPVPTPEPPKPAPVPPVPTPEPVKPAPVPESAPEPPKPEPVPEPEPPKPEPTPEPPAKEPEPTPKPAPKPTLVPETQSSPEVTASTAAGAPPEQSLQRIREIKAIVNDRVGNPVNLVDIDNEVGREYMTALLDAMKKLNSGASATAAMQRLEDAFSAVERTLDEKGDTPPPKPVTPAAAEPAPKPAQPEPVPESPAPEPKPEPTPLPEPEPIPEPPQPAPTPEPEKPAVPPLEMVKPPQSVPVPPPPKPQEGSAMPNVPPAPQSNQVKQVKVEPPKVVPKGAPGPQSKQLTPKEVATAWGPETDTVKPAAEAPKPTPQTITPKASSLAQSETRLRTPEDLPLASAIETSSVSGDPLFTRQVDDGLEQLLSEWSLFKKSGLFGTGPKGREHPLYKKIADLQIPLLLAGRFEGATQEIKQSITDYMNGWRYEQGIIYEQGETFEHYLRRVIRHILDLQEQGQKS